MKWATARIDGKAQFVLAHSASSRSWASWKDYVNLSKVNTSIQTFKDYVQDPIEIHKDLLRKVETHSIDEKNFLLPFEPLSFRDFYCFEEHVKNGRKSRGLEMIPEWYEAPVFYYSNPLSFRGPFEELAYPAGSQMLDCELEIAAVVGKKIRNANLAEARAAILGYSVLNDWSARDFQAWEMKMNMGPTKGKDFCTTLGSFILSADEVEHLRQKKGFDVSLELRINDEVLTTRSWSEIQFSFEEMLVRASQNCTLYPGEVIASGTLGKGSLLEHNVGKESKRWIQKGDSVEIRWLPTGPRIKNKVGESI